MTTTDGYDLCKHHYYLTENGEQVQLLDWGCGQESKCWFLVTYCYEGEAMEVRGYPNGATEVSVPYIHETEETVIYSIFNDTPLAKVDEKYATELAKLESLALTNGELVKTIRGLEADIKRLTREKTKCLSDLSEEEERLRNTKDAVSMYKEQRDTLISEVDSLRSAETATYADTQ